MYHNAVKQTENLVEALDQVFLTEKNLWEAENPDTGTEPLL